MRKTIHIIVGIAAVALAACTSSVVVTLKPSPMATAGIDETFPLKAAAVVDPELYSYEIVCKRGGVTEVSTVRGIPMSFVGMLSGQFEEVELVASDGEISSGGFDVVGKLSVEQAPGPGECPFLLFSFALSDVDGGLIVTKEHRDSQTFITGRTHSVCFGDFFAAAALDLRLSTRLRRYAANRAPNRAPEGPPLIRGRFEVHENGVIRDRKTGLEWYPGEPLGWEEAHAWATGLKAAGGGWRLPSVSELRGIDLRPPDPLVRVLFKINGVIPIRRTAWSGESASFGHMTYDYGTGASESVFDYSNLPVLAVRIGGS